MLALVMQASCWLLRPSYGTIPHWIGGPTVLILSGIIIQTDREGQFADLHNICRGMMTGLFTICFIVIFTKGS